MFQQKISLFSRYERVTDRRTFKDRREVWEIEKTQKEFVPERPKAKIKHVDVPASNDFKRKPKKSGESVHHEEHHEEVKEPDHHEEEEHHEEEHHEEEAPAEEE